MLGNKLLSKPTSIQQLRKVRERINHKRDEDADFNPKFTLPWGRANLRLERCRSQILWNATKGSLYSPSSHPQRMSLEPLGVGLEGDHHTFTNFSGAHHKQGSFWRNL